MRLPTAYPLAWPEGWPRANTRTKSLLKSTLNQALLNVQAELKRFGNDTNRPVSNIVISSDYTLGSPQPKDPGVAVYFTWEEQQVCIPVDCYLRIEANLQAISLIIEAQRAMNRHGGLHIVRAQFRGLTGLPGPAAGEPWWKTLGLRANATADQIDEAYREKAKAAHPDKPGGSHDAMARLNAARDAGKDARKS